MRSFALSSVRLHRRSLFGVFLVVALASLLLTATGVWMEAGLRAGSAAPMLSAVTGSFAGTAILIAVLISASVLAASLRERRGEFALLRAVGATPTQVRGMITAEALIVFGAAVPVGAIPGVLAASSLAPLLVSGGMVPEGVAAPVLSPWPVLATLALLGATALVSARIAARETLRLSAVAAVRESRIDPPALSKGRRVSALVLAVAGLVVAATPLAFPGTLGSATGASSAILLIIAAWLAGPLLVAALAERVLRLPSLRRSAPALLAALGARGFSRRLTSAILPLALLVALGSVQTGVARAVSAASGEQFRDGVQAELVVPLPEEADARGGAAVRAATPSSPVLVLSTVSAQLRSDDGDDELPFLAELAWEPAALGVLSGTGTALLDPGVRAGSLDALETPGTIAVGADALIGSGKGMGDPLDIRLPDGTERTVRIVAVYDRTLGFGEFLVGEGTLAGVDPLADGGTAFVGTDGADEDEVRRALTEAGLSPSDPEAAAERVAAGAAEGQRLSLVLLLALLAFIAVAAANTLAGLIGSRRGEFALLARTGMTPGQLRTMVLLESLFTAAAAIVIGTACVLPALAGAGIGMRGAVTAAFDPAVTGGLALIVLGIAVLAPLLAARPGRGPSPAAVSARRDTAGAAR